MYHSAVDSHLLIYADTVLRSRGWLFLYCIVPVYCKACSCDGQQCHVWFNNLYWDCSPSWKWAWIAGHLKNNYNLRANKSSPYKHLSKFPKLQHITDKLKKVTVTEKSHACSAAMQWAPFRQRVWGSSPPSAFFSPLFMLEESAVKSLTVATDSLFPLSAQFFPCLFTAVQQDFPLLGDWRVERKLLIREFLSWEYSCILEDWYLYMTHQL